MKNLFDYYLESVDSGEKKYWLDPTVVRGTCCWPIGNKKELDRFQGHELDSVYDIIEMLKERDESFEPDEENLSKILEDKKFTEFAINNDFARVSESRREISIQTKDAQFFDQIKHLILEDKPNKSIIWETNNQGTWQFSADAFKDADRIQDGTRLV